MAKTLTTKEEKLPVTSLTVGGHVFWFPYALVLMPKSVFLLSNKAISSKSCVDRSLEGMVLPERYWELVRPSPTRPEHYIGTNGVQTKFVFLNFANAALYWL